MTDTEQGLLQRIQELQGRLDEDEEILRALRGGEVDAIVVSDPQGDRIYTLKGAEEPYRALVQGMAEGAATLAASGLILFSNDQLAAILRRPLEHVIGSQIQNFIAPDDLALFSALLGAIGRRTSELRLQTADTAFVPVYLSFEDLMVDQTPCLSLIVTDLTEQKRNEAIVAEEKFARSVLEQAGEAIFVLDPDGRIVRASRAADLLAGIAVLGLGFDEVFRIGSPGAARFGFQEIAAAAKRGNALQGIEGLALRPDGGRIEVRVRAAALSNSDGSPLGCVVTMTDFTELRHAETELRRSEERRSIAEAVAAERQRLNDVLEMLPVMVCVLTPDHEVRFANRRFREFFGESHGRRCFESVAGLSAPCPQCQAFVPLQTGCPHHWEFTGPEGGCVDVYNLPFPDVDGSPLILEVDIDITERKRAEAALRESEERFRIMADTAPVMIWVSGTDKRCTFFNKGWLSFAGRSMQEETGDGWLAGIHPDDRDRAWSTYSDSFDVRRPYRVEYRRRAAGGVYRWVRSEGAPRFASDGVFAGFVGSCIDITEARRAQEQMLARQKLESVGVLAGGVAHDFNNLLGSILANSEVALGELPGDSPARFELAQINTVSLRASEIVRQLLAYAGKDDAAFEPVDLSMVVAEMLELLKLSISKRATVKADLPANLPAVRGSATQIRQVVMNLVTNASEAFPEEGGVITVATSTVHLSRESSDPDSSLPDGEYVRLVVEDTGYGMTDDVLGKIFDPYFSTKFPGRGLGLAVVRGIVRGHGGGIQVVSAPGRGTRFEILLPCVGAPVSATSPQKEAGCSSADSRSLGTVLVIEDEGALRISVTKMLRKRGFTVLEAADGIAGTDVFRAHTLETDVVLLDMTLPGRSGPDVLRELRRIRPDVKVVLTTAYSEDTVRTAFGNEKTAGFIRKPYRLADLVACLQDACATVDRLA